MEERLDVMTVHQWDGRQVGKPPAVGQRGQRFGDAIWSRPLL